VDGLNVFSYVSNNPIKNKDPTGNFSEEVEVFLDELIPYAYKVKDKASLGKNIQKDHTIAQNLLKKILGPIFQKLYDKEKDLTVAVETGKGEWHTIKSVLERAIREKIVAGDITELNEVVYETVNVLKSANVEVGRAAELISSQYEDNGIKYREYRALGDFQALQRTDQGSKLATRLYISRPFP
jgi:hypothetical protein